jgi:hypothetical protein
VPCHAMAVLFACSFVAALTIKKIEVMILSMTLVSNTRQDKYALFPEYCQQYSRVMHLKCYPSSCVFCLLWNIFGAL